MLGPFLLKCIGGKSLNPNANTREKNNLNPLKHPATTLPTPKINNGPGSCEVVNGIAKITNLQKKGRRSQLVLSTRGVSMSPRGLNCQGLFFSVFIELTNHKRENVTAINPDQSELNEAMS